MLAGDDDTVADGAVALAQLVEQLAQPVGQLAHAVVLPDQFGPEPGRFARPVEQLDADIGLDRAQAAGKGGLRQAAPFRRAVEGAALDDGENVLKPFQAHRATLPKHAESA